MEVQFESLCLTLTGCMDDQHQIRKNKDKQWVDSRALRGAKGEWRKSD